MPWNEHTADIVSAMQSISQNSRIARLHNKAIVNDDDAQASKKGKFRNSAAVRNLNNDAYI